MARPMRWIRYLDALGRLMLPRDIREALGWRPDAVVEIELTETGVILRSLREVCLLCGTPGCVRVRDQYLCTECAAAVATAVAQQQHPLPSRR
jgi:transcriptional pleiotropic regulator of transition state genes